MTPLPNRDEQAGEYAPGQPWEPVAAEVSQAIEKAVAPLVRKSADDIYDSLLTTVQDYLADNIAFNIGSRIDTADREARLCRQALAQQKSVCDNLLEAARLLIPFAANVAESDNTALWAVKAAQAAINKALGR